MPLLEAGGKKHVSMLRKAGFISSFCYLECCRQSYTPTSYPLSSSIWKRPEIHRTQGRRFAHVLHRSSTDPDEDFHWPSTSNFSPYDLLKPDRSGPYCKKRFYRLVKLYHPDGKCDHPACKGLSEPVRLERYRILVAAHELLSDPGKRAAYDRFGIGWHSQNPHVHIQASGSRGNPDPIFRNATWEDWERWREEREGRTAQPTIVSHQTFAVFVVLVALFAGSAQAVAIGKHTSLAEQRSNALNQKCGKFLDERRRLARAQTESGERIQSFLARRDPSGRGLKEEEREVYRQHLGSTAPKALVAPEGSRE